MINNMNIVQYVNMIHMYREIVNYFFSQHYESKMIIHIFRLNCKHDNAVLKHHSAVHLSAPLRNVYTPQQQGLWHFVTAPAWRNARFI